MKKYFLSGLVLLCLFSFVSWGPSGHRAVGQIAENHLTPATKLAVKNLLGSESLADVSTYADEIRKDAAFKFTTPWHYVNITPGLTFEQFAHEVSTMPQDNVYKAVLTCESDLKNPDKTNAQKVAALKLLVHFVGDLHQPMHVSRAEDKGGNDILIKFMGMDGNLHGLWDSGLISHQGLTYMQMASTYDTATPVEIAKWQSDDLMVWLWESYQISTILYKEAADSPDFDEQYYQAHIPIVEKRIEKGGIRLAGALNAIFDPSNTGSQTGK
jgi:hypothetical protein